MKNVFWVIVFCLLSNSLIFSQWSKTYEIESNSEETQNILSFDDGFAILGSDNTTGLLLLKANLDGDTLWTKKYSESLLYRPTAKLFNDSASGFFLTFNNSENYTDASGWIYRLDSKGELIWKQEFAKNKKILHLSDNGFLVLNNNYDTLSLLKITEDGDTSWNKQFVEKTILQDSKIFLHSIPNSGSIITIANTTYPNSTQLTVLKINSNGDSLWTSSFEDIYPYSVYVNQVNNGDYYFAGSSGRSDNGIDGKSYLLQTDSLGNVIKLEFNDTFYGYQYVDKDFNLIQIPTGAKKIIKANEDHNLLWETDLSNELNLIYDPIFMCFTETNNIIFYGIDKEVGPIIFKLDYDGKLLWQKFMGDDLLAYNTNALIPLSENEYIISGSTYEVGTNNLYTDIKAIKFNSPTKSELLFYPNNNETIFTDSLDVRIISNIFASEVYYTLDGSEPNKQSFRYTAPIRIDTTIVIKAIAFASGYETSDITTKEYKFNQEFSVELEKLYVGVDSTFTGSALVNIQIPKPVSSFGDVASLKWFLNNNKIGEGEALSFNFPSGTNKLVLETTGSWGTVQYDTTNVSIYAASYINPNKISSNSFSTIVHFMKKTLVSQFNNQQFLLYNYNYETGQQNSVLLDSTCSILSEKINPLRLSTACILDDSSHVSSTINSYASFLYSNPLFNNWSSELVKIDRGEKISTSPSYLPDSLVYVGTISGTIYCSSILSPTSPLWKYDCGDTIMTDIVITEKENLIFGCADNNLYSLSANGNLNWKFDVSANFESTPALGKDSSIVFGADNNKLYKISINGTEFWTFETNDKIISSPVIDFYGNIYFGSLDGYFYSVSSNGVLNWKHLLGTDGNISASIGKNGLIYVNNGNNSIYVYDKLGETKWQFEIELNRIYDDFSVNYLYEEIVNAPLVTNNNLVLITTTFGNIYIIKENPAFHLTEELPQWATFKGSNQRTGMSNFTITSVENSNNDFPTNYSLSQNYPNPFNPSTTINYSLPQRGFVNLTIYDILGRKVSTLINGEQAMGNYKTEFNASNLTSGIYFYTLQSGDFVATKKLILLR